LNLQEQNGYEVQLSASYFRVLALAPFGLYKPTSAGISRTAQTLAYEVDGTDTAGNKVTATLSVTFQSPG